VHATTILQFTVYTQLSDAGQIFLIQVSVFFLSEKIEVIASLLLFENILIKEEKHNAHLIESQNVYLPKERKKGKRKKIYVYRKYEVIKREKRKRKMFKFSLKRVLVWRILSYFGICLPPKLTKREKKKKKTYKELIYVSNYIFIFNLM